MDTNTATVGVASTTGLTIVICVLVITMKYDRIDLWPVAAIVAAIAAMGLGAMVILRRKGPS